MPAWALLSIKPPNENNLAKKQKIGNGASQDLGQGASGKISEIDRARSEVKVHVSFRWRSIVNGHLDGCSRKGNKR